MKYLKTVKTNLEVFVLSDQQTKTQLPNTSAFLLFWSFFSKYSRLTQKVMHLMILCFQCFFSS